MNPDTPDLPANASVHPCGIWTVYEWPEAFSTNDLGRLLPPWSIAKALVQNGGRGRMNRKWHSGPGGLWVSFVVPLSDNVTNWGPLPLVAGLALLDLMTRLGINGARLRWPNDLLIGKSKLAGILVERPAADKAVIGIGVNVSNDINSVADQLNDPATRLNDLLPAPITTKEVLEALASLLEKRFLLFSAEGFAPLLPDLRKTWKKPVPVVIETCDGEREGLFTGVNEGGHPVLRLGDGTETFVNGAYITRLREKR